MLKYDWEISLECICTVAHGLGDLLDDFVFVGGSTLGFYVDQIPEKLRDVRGSEDVDLIVEIKSRVEFAQLEDSLRRLGFAHDTSHGAPICRFIFAGVKVDVMPTDPSVLSFSNRGYEDGIKNAIEVEPRTGVRIKILSGPFFIAAKFEAFKGRGKKPGEYIYSRDLEDIVTLFDGRTSLVDELTSTSGSLRSYLQEEIQRLLIDQEFLDSMSAFVRPDPRARSRIAGVRARIASVAEQLQNTSRA